MIKQAEHHDEQRERRAMAIAGMGLVNREGDHFKVTSPAIRANRKSFVVRRNLVGAVVCDCDEFVKGAGSGSPIRCEHILAVKFALAAKNTEPTVRENQTSAESSSEIGFEDANTKTESRTSERGEQTNEIASDENAENRRAAF